MPHRVNTAQLRNKLRQLENQQRRAINNYNQKVREYNNARRRAINEANRAISDYNRKARAHNARVRVNRQKLARELAKLNSRPRRSVTVQYTTYQTSVQTLHRSFNQLQEAAESESWSGDYGLVDMAEDETANSVAVLNALLDESTVGNVEDDRLRQTIITTELREISAELDDRWRGALFSLSPPNPDAARHFCTSCREILVGILDLKVPDSAVLAANPDVELTQSGQVPRREKIYYCLLQRGQSSPALATFVDNDINNVMELFRVFNSGTHGKAGEYDLSKLRAIKTRVEGAIQFLHRIVG